MPRFELVYAQQTREHLRAIEQKYHSLIRNTIQAQLQFEPDVETKNRKPLECPVEFGADWEIRFGSNNRFRVFYEVDREQKIVNIVAIGVKYGNRLFIGKDEVKL